MEKPVKRHPDTCTYRWTPAECPPAQLSPAVAAAHAQLPTPAWPILGLWGQKAVSTVPGDPAERAGSMELLTD